jgi:hypothetical protein
MSRFTSSCAIIGVALLTGCGVTAPLKPDSANAVKQAKTAIVFYDGIEQINYIADEYFVLGVAQVGSHSAYHGIWDSNKELSALNAEELTKIGLQAQSIYANRSLDEIAQFEPWLKTMHEDLHPAPKKQGVKQKTVDSGPAPVVVPQLREALQKDGYNHLIWISWSGYTLHLQTLGLPPMSQMTVSFRIIDLQKNAVVWDGAVGVMEKTSLGSAATGKEFLENDNLSGLKLEVARIFRERYQRRAGHGGFNNSIGQMIGIETTTVASQK